jgi:hypothetical protein
MLLVLDECIRCAKNRDEGACTPASIASALPDRFEEDTYDFRRLRFSRGCAMPLIPVGLMMEFNRVHHDFVIPMTFAFAGSNSAFELITI